MLHQWHCALQLALMKMERCPVTRYLTVTCFHCFPGAVEGEVPAPRHSHGAVALDDHRILVFGGWDACAEPPCHFGDAAVLDTRTWVRKDGQCWQEMQWFMTGTLKAALV